MISILIPAYNYSILQLVRAINEQCEELLIKYEILVQEDASEQSFQLENQQINSFENCDYFVNPINVGRTKSREILANRAKYNWLLFLDSDVLPTDKNFIASYIAGLNFNYPVVIGGIKYRTEKIPSFVLRYNYGKKREEKNVSSREKNPYKSIISGNILIKKEIFLATNYSGSNAIYGMDIFFAYQLFIKQIPILHIDNPVFHLGLESNVVFLEKSLESVKSRKEIMIYLEKMETINGLIKNYKLLQKYKLVKFGSMIFLIMRPILHKNLLSKSPFLLFFDIYRLGYMCSLK